MGIYVYTLRAKKTILKVDNTPTVANLLSYAFKPCNSWEPPPYEQRTITRAENFWFKKDTPDVFVIGDKFENGNEVRKGWPQGSSSCYDAEWPGEHLGFLKKVGRRWTVVPTEDECLG